jgi:HD-GYP domain-containing protein (c-di-GMP phosphodiesterase class II)
MHHERCDGSGYPQNLKGDAIEDFAEIIAIADVYDAMTAARSYRAPMCPFQVIAAFEKDGLGKYNTKFILTFLERIASTYQSNRVLLNDGRGGDIVMLNRRYLSKPIVQLDDGSCIDLSTTPELHIQSLL